FRRPSALPSHERITRFCRTTLLCTELRVSGERSVPGLYILSPALRDPVPRLSQPVIAGRPVSAVLLDGRACELVPAPLTVLVPRCVGFWQVWPRQAPALR